MCSKLIGITNLDLQFGLLNRDGYAHIPENIVKNMLPQIGNKCKEYKSYVNVHSILIFLCLCIKKYQYYHIMLRINCHVICHIKIVGKVQVLRLLLLHNDVNANSPENTHYTINIMFSERRKKRTEKESHVNVHSMFIFLW